MTNRTYYNTAVIIQADSVRSGTACEEARFLGGEGEWRHFTLNPCVSEIEECRRRCIPAWLSAQRIRRLLGQVRRVVNRVAANKLEARSNRQRWLLPIETEYGVRDNDSHIWIEAMLCQLLTPCSS
jgi:hypothetical protein